MQGYPKLVNRSQPLVGRSSPYCGDMWRTYCCLTSFFRLSICALVAKTCDKVVRWCPDGDFLCPAFPLIHVQHVSDLRPKFALRRHHCVVVWQTSNLRRLRLGEGKKKKKPQGKNIMSASATQGGHNEMTNAKAVHNVSESRKQT